MSSQAAQWEEILIEFLAHVYRRIPWRKISTSKNAWDVWNHRVRAAATRGTMGEFASRLCNWFGLQHLPPRAIMLLEALRPDERQVLDMLYREHIPYAMRAVMLAKQMKEEERAASAQD